MAFTNSKGRTSNFPFRHQHYPLCGRVLVLLDHLHADGPGSGIGDGYGIAQNQNRQSCPADKVVVTIDKDRNYYVGNDMVNIHLLGQSVLKRLNGSPNQPVYIRCVENVKFGTFVQVVDALKQANVTNLVIVTEPLDTRGSS